MIGHYASPELMEPGDYRAGQIPPGVRWTSIEIRLTRRDYCDFEIQNWLTRHLFCRVANPRTTPIHITVLP